MVNKQSRSPGQLARFEANGRISGDVPAFAIYTGQASEALASVAGGLANRLSKLADQAAAREGALAGLSAGAQSGAEYLKARAVSDEAAGTGNGPGISVRAPGELRKIVADAAARYGVDPAALQKIAMIESSFNPKAKNPNSSAGGLFQFIDGTARDYGLADRYDPAAAADAAARLARDNAATLRKTLGRDPTAGELYLAHQQGGGGASKLLKNPNARAADIVGAKAVRLNGGTLDMTAGQFANLWIRKAGGGPGLSGASVPVVQRTGEEIATPEPLSTTPLALRRDGTIRGDAMDRAAVSSYAWRMQEGLSRDLYAAHEANQDDPQAFQAAAEQVRQNYLQDDNLQDPEIREQFDKNFADRSQVFFRSTVAAHEKKLREEELASYAGSLASQSIELERKAQLLGANPDGDALVAEEVKRSGRLIDAALANGTITPLQAEKAKIELGETAARGRIQGVYDALPTADAKRDFALSLLEDWKSGEGPLAAMPYATVKGISETLRRSAQADAETFRAENKVEAARITRLIEDDVASVGASGKGLDTDEQGLTPDRVREYLGEEKFAEWQEKRETAGRLYDATAGMELQSAADIGERLALIAPKPGDAGFAEQAAIFNAAREKADAVLKERETDPLGQAARAGAIEVAELDTSSPEALAQSLADRRDASDTVTSLYGAAAPVFRPGEQAALSAAIMNNPQLLPGFAGAVTQVFGKRAPQVLSEISEDGPVIAHAAGLAAATGDTSIARDVAETLSLKAQKVYQQKMPDAATLSRYGAAELGGAFAGNPRTQAAVMQTAAILFEQAANREGFDPTAIKTAGSPAQTAYFRAIDRAAGGRKVGGVAYGGISDVNGSAIIVPPDLPKSQPQALVENLTADQLEKLPPIGTANGVAITHRQIRGAYLTSAGDGLYRVSLGDPASDDPRYLTSPDGGFWLLDIRALGKVSTALPGASFDGYRSDQRGFVK